MDRKSVEVFIPDREECYERLRRARFGATVACLYCGVLTTDIDAGEGVVASLETNGFENRVQFRDWFELIDELT